MVETVVCGVDCRGYNPPPCFHRGVYRRTWWKGDGFYWWGLVDSKIGCKSFLTYWLAEYSTKGWYTVRGGLICDNNSMALSHRSHPGRKPGRPTIPAPCGWCGQPFPVSRLIRHLVYCPRRPEGPGGVPRPTSRNEWLDAADKFQEMIFESRDRINAGAGRMYVFDDLYTEFSRLMAIVEGEFTRLRRTDSTVDPAGNLLDHSVPDHTL